MCRRLAEEASVEQRLKGIVFLYNVCSSYLSTVIRSYFHLKRELASEP